MSNIIRASDKDKNQAPKAVQSEKNSSFVKPPKEIIPGPSVTEEIFQSQAIEEKVKTQYVKASESTTVATEDLDPAIRAELEALNAAVRKKPIVEETIEEEEEEYMGEEELEVVPKEEPVKKDSKLIKIKELLKDSQDVKEDNDDIFKSLGVEDIPIEKVVEVDFDDEFLGFEDDFVEEKKEEKKEAPKKAKRVDISKLSIINKTEIDKERDLRQALFNNKAAYQVVAAQSGYMAQVAPLVHKDINNLLNGNVSRYEYRKNVYEVIFNKIFKISVGEKFTFDQWLKNTSVEDMETFFYGVYAATFPNKGKFNYSCPVCGKDHDYTINHANLVKTTDREHMKKLIDEVSRNSTSIEMMKQFSLIGKNEAFELSETGIVVELKTPTLFDSLEILRTVPEEAIDKDVASVTNMLYINQILIPTANGAGFSEERERLQILRIIDNLPPEDSEELQNSVYDRVDSNRISYSIKNIKCPNCEHIEKDLPISIEDILFQVIFERTQ
jgi:LAS superfamily LD-carboxypeptidase LdcB